MLLSLSLTLSTHISNAPVIPADPVDMTGELTIEIGKHSQETTKLLYHLACALAADTGVKQTISEKIIASAAANSQFKRPTQSVVSSGVQMPIISSGASVNTVQSGLTPKSLTPSVSKAISSKLKIYTTPSKSSATSATRVAPRIGSLADKRQTSHPLGKHYPGKNQASFHV